MGWITKISGAKNTIYFWNGVEIMIYGRIENLQQEKRVLSGIIQKGLEYLKNTDFTTISTGRYELDGDTMFALVSEYETELKSVRRPEAHKQYIDIQYIVKGEEAIGHSFLAPANTVLEEYNAEKDIVFYRTVIGESYLRLDAGTYAVFFPDDIHRPCCTSGKKPSSIRKVVLKIKVDVLG
jgi:biofilm protein TabA